VDDVTQWIAGIEEGQNIDTESLNHWLGYRRCQDSPALENYLYGI